MIVNYPYLDRKCNPQMDMIFEHDSRMGKLREIVAKNVKTRMGKERQKPFAARAGIAQSHVSRMRNGRSGITIDVLEEVAQALHCRPFELLLETEADKRAVINRLFGEQSEPDGGGDRAVIRTERPKPGIPTARTEEVLKGRQGPHQGGKRPRGKKDGSNTIVPKRSNGNGD